MSRPDEKREDPDYAPEATDGTPRPLHAIAREIREDWARPYFGAVPYLDALASLGSIDGMYYMDTADSVVRYFLSNATTWRGPVARRVKAELKAMLKP
jgi:hypothetical protein